MDVAEKNEKKLRRQMRTTSKILLGFLLAILTGAVLLTLPVATVSGKSDFLTALFTATTSVCVTGLVVVPTFSYWTLFGKIVILALIQLGGLGIVALTSFVMLLMNRKFSLRNRMMIQDAFGLSTMQGMVVFIKRRNCDCGDVRRGLIYVCVYPTVWCGAWNLVFCIQCDFSVLQCRNRYHWTGQSDDVCGFPACTAHVVVSDHLWWTWIRCLVGCGRCAFKRACKKDTGP